MIATLRKSPLRAVAGGSLLVLLLLAAVAYGAGGSTEALPAVGYARLALGTLIAVGLVLFCARFLPRLAGVQGLGGEHLRVVASLPVGQRERVVVIQVGTQQLLLGVAPGRVEMLRDLPTALPTREAAQGAVLRPDWLQNVLGRRP